MTVNGNLVSVYTDYVTSAMSAFLPLIASVIGIFLAFAIANQIRHLIMRMK
jgi:hypothetical protein